MIPTKVTICGIPHDIVMCEDNFDTECHLGQITYSKAEIKLNSEATPAVQMQALVHEVVHGLLVYLGYNDLSSEEQFVQALACGINQTFRLKEDVTE